MTTIAPPTNGGIVPPWLRSQTPPPRGVYPVPQPITVDDVQRLLADNGFVEFVCDEAPVRA